MTDDLVTMLRKDFSIDMKHEYPQTCLTEYEYERQKAADRIEKLEAALLNIVATFGYGPSRGAYKGRYFRCLDIAKAELKHLGLGGTYPPYVKYRDKIQAMEGVDD